MEEKINQAQENLIQVILANTSSAMKISKILCEHSNDKILKSDEIICGLIYRLMIPMTNEEITQSMNEAEDLMYQESSEDEEIEYINDSEDLKFQKKIKTNHCNCEICSQVRVCLLNFNNYIPKDDLGDKFKKSIYETCQTHNKII